MPVCCGVESEKKVFPNGGYTYYCHVCKKEWLPAEGLESVGLVYRPTIITVSKPVKVKRRR